MKYFEQGHRAPEDRQKGLASYSLAAYQPRFPSSRNEWADRHARDEGVKDARIIVRAVQDSQDLRGKMEFPAAVAAMAPALKTSYAALPFVANEAGQTFEAAGDFVNAEKQFALRISTQIRRLTAILRIWICCCG